MKKTITLLSILIIALSSITAWAMDGHDMKSHDTKSHDMKGHDMNMQAGHGDKTAGSMDGKEMFKHQMTVNGVRAEFEVMSLAAMGMKSEGGNTHHIMVQFFDEKTGTRVETAAGKIKLIAPSGKEQVGTLKNYSGVFAANFTFQESGRHGVICLVKVDGRKHIYKFWYTRG